MRTIEIEEDKLMDIIEAALYGRMAFDDIREALEEIQRQIFQISWEVVE